jgi:hypothetical protein
LELVIERDKSSRVCQNRELEDIKCIEHKEDKASNSYSPKEKEVAADNSCLPLFRVADCEICSPDLG